MRARYLHVGPHDVTRAPDQLPEDPECDAPLLRGGGVDEHLEENGQQLGHPGLHLGAADLGEDAHGPEHGQDDARIRLGLLELRHEDLEDRLHVGSDEPRRRDHEVVEHTRGLLLVPAHARVLELRQELDEGLAQRRHHVGRIHVAQAADRPDR
jgi:hypothetical protein